MENFPTIRRWPQQTENRKMFKRKLCIIPAAVIKTESLASKIRIITWFELAGQGDNEEFRAEF